MNNEAYLPMQTTIVQHQHLVSRPVKRGSPLVAIIKSALNKTKQGDAFQFLDRRQNPIHVGRANLAHYGFHYRVSHDGVTYILPYTTLAERCRAAEMVREYLQAEAVMQTLKLLPFKALDFRHAYRGENYSSKQYVLAVVVE